jgi:hypothetical protein
MNELDVDIKHEASSPVSAERQEEIDKMDKTKRVFTLAKNPRYPNHRMASDKTVYRKLDNGQLIRVQPKLTKKEKRALKRAKHSDQES